MRYAGANGLPTPILSRLDAGGGKPGDLQIGPMATLTPTLMMRAVEDPGWISWVAESAPVAEDDGLVHRGGAPDRRVSM